MAKKRARKRSRRSSAKKLIPEKIRFSLLGVHGALETLVERLDNQPDTEAAKKLRTIANNLLSDPDCGNTNVIDLISGDAWPKEK
jgi:hypothetical protein